jgi:hypothetical protein
MKSLNTFFTLEWNENVPFAENYTKLVNVLNKMLSVPITVSLLGDEKLALTMLQGFVKFVETNLLLTNITRQQHVIELVQQGFGKKTKVKFLKEVPNEDVYCCSVDYLDSFVVEGGLVVHNCDALRYLCMAPAHLWSLPEREQPKSNVVPMSNYAQGWS